MANPWKIDPTQARILTIHIQNGDLYADDDDIGNFMLLLRALTFEDDMTKREELLLAVEQVLMPFIVSVDRVLENLCVRRLKATRKAE